MLIEVPKPTDDLDLFKRRVCLAISRLATSKLGQGSSPEFAGLTIGGGAVSSTLIQQWSTAYGWGDHSGLYDLVGSAAGEVGDHESAYDHTLLHDPVTLSGLTGVTLTGQQLSLTGGYVIPTTTKESNWDTAYSAAHDRQHSLTSASDHTSGATAGQLLKADANGLPVDATNTDAAVAAAVTASHAAVTIPVSSNGLSLTGQEISFPITATPQVTRLGVGVAADGTIPLVVYGTGFPVGRLHRRTTGTDFVSSGYQLLTASTGDIVDGFGGAIVFSLMDDAAVVNNAGRLACYRDGADDSGALGFDVGGIQAVYSNMAMHLRASGRLGLGIQAPAAKFHAKQGTSDAAIPVVMLEQADVSEEFIKFKGAAASANLTQSIVDAADVTTATIAGYVKVFVDDTGNRITDQAYYMPIFTLA